MKDDLQTRDALLTAEANRRMFDAIVPRYDTLNRVLSLGMDRAWRRRAVERLAPAAGGVYLDAGCGTGDLCLEILRQAPGARVVGVDASESMLARAREKLHDAGGSDEVRLQVDDVCALSCEAAVFDGVISGFCLRNLTDRRKAFRELQRVIRPDGTIVLLELTRPECRFVRLCHGVYSRCVVRPLGGALSRGQAYRYLVDSIDAFPKPMRIKDEMIEAGMNLVELTPLSGGTVTIFSGCRGADDAREPEGERQ